ncbi:WD-40 repeat protein, partial [Reticulomyxa filosa]
MLTLDGPVILTRLSANLLNSVFFFFLMIFLLKMKYFRLLKVLQGHHDEISDVKFSPDGCKIVSYSDETIRIWDVVSGKQLEVFQNNSDMIVEFSSDGKLINKSCSDDEISKLYGGKLKKDIEQIFGSLADLATLDFSPNGQMMVSSYDNLIIYILDIHSGELLKELEGHSDYIINTIFSPNNQFVVSYSWDKTFRIWDVNTGKELKRFEGQSDILTVKYLDNQTLISCSDDNTIRLWDVETGQEIERIEDYSEGIQVMNISPDGSKI